jgi:hypothetical protein
MVYDIPRKRFPELMGKAPEERPSAGLGADVYKVDDSKTKTISGLNFQSLDECTVDTATNLLKIEEAEQMGRAENSWTETYDCETAKYYVSQH